MSFVDTKAGAVAEEFVRFVEQELFSDTKEAELFWDQLALLVSEFAPEYARLHGERDRLQSAIDTWHKQHPESIDISAYRAVLEQTGYLQPEPETFSIATANVDREIAEVKGPQLVVPVSNARYAINAANARWGSFYDALYGTDVISQEGGAERAGGYNPVRGDKVIRWVRGFLDKHFPLEQGSHAQAAGYALVDGQLQIAQIGADATTLADGSALKGYRGEPSAPQAILLQHHGLHAEILIDATTPVGSTDAAGVYDVLLESALTTIMDCEDSAATVDAQDKTLVYRNLLHLMRGDITTTFQKGGGTMERRLADDRQYLTPRGESFSLSGRSLMLVRVIGDHVTSNMLQTQTPESLIDLLVVAHITKRELQSQHGNSRTGSVYIVKPKLHGPDEVALTNSVFARVEDLAGIPANTIKMGIMDEERRTSLNLRACIKAASNRVVFINTGFLDRTGDEIHTAMEAGAVVRKSEMKTSHWLTSYEKRNVEVGLDCGLAGRAQIGKGMWAAPDEMAAMVREKIGHLMAGADCAWVPSPTAATLHATHYHEVDVREQQKAVLAESAKTAREDLMRIPLAGGNGYSPEEIQSELDNNAQGILGYVVRWVDQGVGCSKVPDINDVGLMEDRATLRISSQHIANWLHHGLCTAGQVEETLKRMAVAVDKQNADDSDYRPMATDYDGSIAFQAARDLVFKGREQPNGYTEHILIDGRRKFKAKEAS